MINFRSSTPISIETAAKMVPAIFSEVPHVSRSEKYVHIPTYEIVNRMQKEGFAMYSLTAASPRNISRRASAKHIIRFRHESVNNVQVNDEFFEICLVNSHDGSSTLGLLAGMFRLVCSNGLVISNGFCESMTVRHQNITVDGILENATNIVENSNQIFELKSMWEGIELNYIQKYELAAAAHRLKFEERVTPVKPEDFLIVRREEDNKNDLWTVFNVIQENLINGGIVRRGSHRQMRTRPIRNIYQNIRLNQSLWEEASKLAIDI